jgi:hypothetical protein
LLPLLALLAECADVGDRIDRSPRVPAEAAEPFRRTIRSPAEHERIVRHLDREAVTRLDPQAMASLAWYRDLMLGTHLHADHTRMIPSTADMFHRPLALCRLSGRPG